MKALVLLVILVAIFGNGLISSAIPITGLPTYHGWTFNQNPAKTGALGVFHRLNDKIGRLMGIAAHIGQSPSSKVVNSGLDATKSRQNGSNINMKSFLT